MGVSKFAAIDLGTKSLRLDVAKVSAGDRIEVLYHNDFPSAGINRGKVVNPSRLGAVLREAVESAGKFLGYPLENIAVSSQKCEIHCIEKTVSMDLDAETGISRENIEFLKDLACNEAAQQLGEGETILAAVPQCYNAGDEMAVPACDLEGMMVDRIEGRFKIFTGKSSYERQIDAAFREAGIGHIKPVFCGAEMGEAVLGRNEMMNGVAVVDFGAGATSVCIYHGGVLRHYGAIPFGGNSISADVRNLCDISDSLAENIKLAYGGCMPERLASLGEKTLRINDIESGGRKEITAKYLSEIITARTREIVEAILYEIQLSGYADKLKNGIVLTGGCSTMLNLGHLIKQLSGYEAKVAAPSYNVFKSSSKLFFSPTSASSAALLVYTSRNIPGTAAEPRPGLDTAFTPAGENPGQYPGGIFGQAGGQTYGQAGGYASNEAAPSDNGAGKDADGGEEKKDEEGSLNLFSLWIKNSKKARKDTGRQKKEKEKKVKDESSEGTLFGNLMDSMMQDDFK